MIQKNIRDTTTLNEFKDKLQTVDFPWCKCEKCISEQTLHILS